MTRTRTAATKLTPIEHMALNEVARANGMSPSAWLRKLVIESNPKATQVSGEQVLLAEMLALRAIAINLLFTIGTISPLTQEAVAKVIASADNDKLAWALAQLTTKEK